MAFLQARMGSTRLPGKVLMRIRGRSILERAVRRLEASDEIDRVVVLTTEREADDAVVLEARRLGISTFRGPEEDVLERFRGAAEEFRPDMIVRATADNPLIDIDSVSRIVRYVRAAGIEYCMERDLPYGAATEAVTSEALRRTAVQATEHRHREHVTLYVKERPELFSVMIPQCPARVRYPQITVTVDTWEDFAFVDQLIGCVPEDDVATPLEKYLPYALKTMDQRELKASSPSCRYSSGVLSVARI